MTSSSKGTIFKNERGARQGSKGSLQDCLGHSRLLILETESGSALAKHEPLLEFLANYREKSNHPPVLQLRGWSPSWIVAGEGTALHAETRAWIEAGDLFEKVLEADLGTASIDMVICRDPWAALIAPKSRIILPKAKWVYLDDLAERQKVSNREYWQDTAEYIRSLPFDHVLTLRELESEGLKIESPSPEPSVPSIREGPAPSTPAAATPRAVAWRWERVEVVRKDKPRASSSALFAIRHQGTLLALRACLDSLTRQRSAGGSVEVCVLVEEDSLRIQEVVQSFSISYPEHSFKSRSASEFLGSLAENKGDGRVVIADDRILFPPDFLHRISTMTRDRERVRFRRVPLGTEVTAHVLVGNVDPMAHYEKLLRSHEGTSRPDGDCAYVISLGSQATLMTFQKEKSAWIEGLIRNPKDHQTLLGFGPWIAGGALLSLGDVP